MSEENTDSGGASGNVLRDLQNLIRIENSPTAIADVLAGALLVRHLLGGGALYELLLLVASSVLLYSGGMVLNDYSDVKRDRSLHPDRPLPAGRVSSSTAFYLAGTLLFSGMFLTLWVGPVSVMVAFVLFTGIVLYNFLCSTLPVMGPVAMGLLRMLNFMLGLTFAGMQGITIQAGLVFSLFVGFHIFLVTSISILEESPKRTSTLSFLFGSDLLLLVILMVYIYITVPSTVLMGALVPFVIYAVWSSYRFYVAYQSPSPGTIGAVVGTGVKGIILVDAMIIGGVLGTLRGLSFLALLIPIYLVKMFDVGVEIMRFVRTTTGE